MKKQSEFGPYVVLGLFGLMCIIAIVLSLLEGVGKIVALWKYILS